MTFRDRLTQWRQSRTWKWTWLVVGTVASGGLAWAVLHSLAWGLVLDTFQEFPVTFALLSLLPMAASMALRSFRWQVLLKGQPANGWQVFLAQNTGIGINNLLPIRMVSEPVQLLMVTRRYGVEGSTALATLVAANVLDIFATAILMGMGVVFVSDLRGAEISIPLAGSFILFIISILVFIVVARGLGAIPIAGRIHFFQRLTVAVGLLRQSPKRLWLSFGATLAHWFLLGLAAWVLAEGLGMDLNVVTLTAIMVAATFFTSAVPSLPGAAGTYEFALIYTLRLLGVDDAPAFAFAVMVHLLTFAPTSGIALVMLSRVGAAVIFRRSPNGVANAVPEPAAHENPS